MITKEQKTAVIEANKRAENDTGPPRSRSPSSPSASASSPSTLRYTRRTTTAVSECTR